MKEALLVLLFANMDLITAYYFAYICVRRGIYNSLRDSNCRMQFWNWHVSLSLYSILLSIQSRLPLPLFQIKKRIGLKVESSPTSLRFVLGEGFITRFPTLTAACSFGVGV